MSSDLYPQQIPGRPVVTIWLDTPEMQFRTIDGLSIRFAESDEQRPSRPSAQPMAGEPAGVRTDLGGLATHTHLVAVDLPGFGHSQRRNAMMSPRAMGEFVIRLADAFGLRALTS